jgi:hypothetical protein
MPGNNEVPTSDEALPRSLRVGQKLTPTSDEAFAEELKGGAKKADGDAGHAG